MWVIKDNKYNRILEIIILGVVTLTLSLFFVGLVGVRSLLTLMALSIITTPLIVIVVAKYDELSAVSVLVIVFAVTLGIFSLLDALLVIISFGITGLSIGHVFRNKLKLNQSIIFSGVAYAVGFILINLVSIKFNKVNVIQDILVNGTIIPLMNLTIQSFKNSEEQVFRLVNSILINIPAIITITSFVLGFFIIMVSLFLTRKAGYNVTSIESFSKFRLPAGIVWVSIVTQVLSMGNGEGYEIDSFAMVFSNISYTLNFFFMVQGVALVDFFFKKWGLQGPLRVIVYLVGGIVISPFIFIPVIPFVLAIAGVLDVLMDFRKLEAK